MAIIGKNTIGGLDQTRNSTKAQQMIDHASYTYVAAADQEVFKLWHYMGPTYGGDGTGVDIAVYDITGGTGSATLVAEGNIPDTGLLAWHSVTITPVALTAGNTYAVARSIKSATNIKEMYDYVSQAMSNSSLTGTSPFAASWTDSAGEGNAISIYAETQTAAVSSTASRNVTNVAAGSVQTFQVMAAGVNTTVGEGLGGSDLVVIEDNHQVTVPLVVSGVTITIDSDTLDYQLDQTEMAAAGNSITFDAVYYSPTTEQSSKIAVTVTAPAADTPPTSPANQAVNVTEGNTAVGNTSTATGTAPMTYSKGGTDAASFNVNSTTGALTFITAPDYEVKTSYSVTVVANNTFGTDSHIVTVTILNALEAPVMPTTATRNVAQPNQLMGVYATSNTPNPAASYTLTGTDAGLLSINGSTGAVSALSPTSVAGKSSYSFNVVATNSEGTDTTAVTVTIVLVVARNMTEWIEANGAGGQTNEAWLKYMLGAGASGKTFNDLMFDWLGVLGYTGSLTERVAEWTEANLN